MSRRTTWVAVAAFVAVVALLAMACSHSEEPAPSPGSQEIEGTYRGESGPNTLEFKGVTWTLTTGARVFSGKFVVVGDEIVFVLTYANHPAYDDFCRTDLDVYTWSLVDGALILRPAFTTSTHRAAGRPCNTVADQVFRNGPWTKQG